MQKLDFKKWVLGLGKAIGPADEGGSGTGAEVAASVKTKLPMPRVLLSFRVVFHLLPLIFLSVLVSSLLGMFLVKRFGFWDIGGSLSSVIEFEEMSILDSSIRAPSNLLHSMSDSELFWRASFVPSVKNYPFKRVPKIAFMFLTKGSLPLAPLWERFFRGHEGLYSVYIHSHPSYVAEFPVTSVFFRRQIPSQVARWGEMSMCDAERKLLANALLDISNEWFVLLSEACIPLQHFSIVYLYISRSRYSFVDSFDDPGPYGRGRYDANMAPEVNLTDWRKGSQWFEVNRKLAVDIISDSVYYPKFRDFCWPGCYVDEHYFPTMLTMQSPHLLANRSLTWADWSRGGAHPASFGKADATIEFFRRINEGKPCIYNNQPSSLCFLFARKFAPSSLEPLLNISSEVFKF